MCKCCLNIIKKALHASPNCNTIASIYIQQSLKIDNKEKSVLDKCYNLGHKGCKNRLRHLSNIAQNCQQLLS